MLWIWSCPVSTEEMFLKIAAPKRQTKSSKSNCEVAFITFIRCTPEIYYKQFFSQAFFKDFAKALLKDFADFPLYGIVKNLIIYFAKLFDIFLVINLPLFPLFYQTFASASFKEHLWLFQLILA